ncbi:hypothetical protein [Desulfovirgula thermocuniculi]|uniref:hypothetical protein n=1 Tax=Desulfovirgula thermocuniculi TaxID=348842 RepID=UPI001B7FBD51|nr:hypothetical protein [Desulfovirgula thermocuniculi]
MRRLLLTTNLLFILLICLILTFTSSAFAATTNSALWVPNASPDSTAQLGGLLISESYAGSIKKGDLVNVVVPTFININKLKISFPGGSSYSPPTTGAVSKEVYEATITSSDDNRRYTIYNVVTVTLPTTYAIDFSNMTLTRTYKVEIAKKVIEEKQVGDYMVKVGETVSTLESKSVEIKSPCSYDGEVELIGISTAEKDKLKENLSDQYKQLFESLIALRTGEIVFKALNQQQFVLKWNYNSPTSRTFRAYVYFDEVYIKPVAPGELDSSDIKVTLDAPSTSGFSSGSVTIGRLLTFGGSTITAGSPTNITDNGGKIADITLKEDVAGALKKNDTRFPQMNTVKLVLSPGFSWDNVTLIPLGGFSSGSVHFAVYTERDGCSALYLKINNESSGSPGQLVIKASVKVNEPLTTSRDVKVTYGGTNPGVGGERIAEVTVAKYLVPGLTVMAKNALDVVAGRLNQQIGSFTIAEGMPGDLPQGRLISLTLPEGAKWNQVPQVSLEAGNGSLEFRGTRDEGRTVTFVVKTASSERAVFCFKNATVDLALGAPEELAVTVKGPGVSSTVTVAHVQAPVAVSAAGGTVRIGVQGQSVGALTIQENLVGALRVRDASGNRAVLRLNLPSGVRFARVPAVKVTAGDLELDATGIKLDDNEQTLVIPVKLPSTTPVERQRQAKFRRR